MHMPLESGTDGTAKLPFRASSTGTIGLCQPCRLDKVGRARLGFVVSTAADLLLHHSFRDLMLRCRDADKLRWTNRDRDPSAPGEAEGL